jgi:glyoxylase-like metal-dependent hydrolase (beta-lactamase superfamily II)
MIFRQTGKIVDGLYVLGNTHFPAHLVTGTRHVLFEAGIACLGPLYLSEMQKIIKKEQPTYLFLTHVHFDHCGAAAFLKRQFPGMKIGASPKAADIIRRPNAVKTIARLNNEAKGLIRNGEEMDSSREVPFEPFDVDLLLKEGDRIEIDDGLTVTVLETPGHTRDSLSFHIPQKKWVFMGEAAGVCCPTGFISTEFLADFDAYMHNLERLATLRPDLVCQSHFALFTGEDAKTFFSRSIEAAHRFKARADEFLDQERGDVDKVVARIKAVEYDSMPDPKQPLTAYLLNLQARVRHLASRAKDDRIL